MEFLIIPIEKLKTIDPYWETRRRSNDGKKAIIHKEIYDALVPEVKKPIPEVRMMRAMPMMASLPTEPEERQYPFPVVTGDELNTMEEFQSKEERL